MWDWRFDMVPYTRGKGVVLNPMEALPYSHFFGVDEVNLLGLFASETCDFVVCNHVPQFNEEEKKTLPALPDFMKVWRKIKRGGYLVLNLETALFAEIGDIRPYDLVAKHEMDYNRRQYRVYKRLNGNDPKEVESHAIVQAEPRACVVRYGGFGDMVQMASVLPGLKDQGFHVTLNTDPPGYDIAKSEPLIDDFIIQDKDQVPNQKLGSFWRSMATDFDRFVNLSESVEGALLAVENRAPFYWTKEARHRYMNVNYMELTHAIAGVKNEPAPRFVPTSQEHQWAKKLRNKLHGDPLIVWALSGSSVHKTWPWLDNTLAWIMTNLAGAKVVLVGDPLSQLLEAGWQKEPRIKLTCGEWEARQSLSIAQYADMVIGPETGVLNSVSARDDIIKIMYLSHSSPENIGKHWKNSFLLLPEGCDCWPCHMIHPGWETCTRDEVTGTADCQAKISFQAMTHAINHMMEQRRAA